MTTHQARRQFFKPTEAVIEWLLDSDPSIRWQVMRDLIGEPDTVVASERLRVGTEGWGAQLLAPQNSDGTWGDTNSATTWESTLYTLLLLRNLGLDPTSSEARRAIGLVRDRVTWRGWDWDGTWRGLDFEGTPFFEGEVEPCINGGVLALGSYYGAASERLLERLLGEQLEDGGWNCEAERGSVRSSFHTTICVLEGLLAYEKARGAIPAVTAARERAQEYLLERRMFRSLSSGEVIDPDWTQFSFPTTWHYDILRGLDYLHSAGVTPDERVAEAVELVAQGQDKNGYWPLQHPHSDPVGLEMEDGVGRPSRWNTLRALRVLDWYGTRP